MLPISNILVDPSPINKTSGTVEAVALGMPALLIAATNPATVLLGLSGTVTSIALTRMVSPGVNVGLATVLVVIP